MKATAKSNIKHKGVWYSAGDVFEIDSKEVESFGGLIEVTKQELPKPKEESDEKAKFADMKKPKAKAE